MPNNCTGLIGRIFGHKFRTFLIKATPVVQKDDFWSNAVLISSFHGTPTNREWVVRCARCGKRVDEREPGK